MSTEKESSEHEELLRLRAEVASLRAAQAGSPRNPPDVAPGTRGSGRWTGRLRAFGAAILIFLGCVMAPVSVVASWLDTHITDTDAYVETIDPLIDDPALQQALSRTVTAAVMEELDVEGTAETALEALAGRTDLPAGMQDRITGLSVPMTDGVQGFVEGQVLNVVSSERFADVWAEANRAVHAQLVATLTGQTRDGVEISEGGQVALDIAPFVEIVKGRLVERGIGVAASVPEIHTSFVLFEVPRLGAAQAGFAALDLAGAWLIIGALAVLASGVLVARNRRRATMVAGLGVAASMLALAGGLWIARELYLGYVPAELLSRPAAAAAFDTVVRFLRTGLRTAFVVGVIVAGAAYLTGRSVTATGVRTGISSGFHRIRTLGGRPGGLAGERVGGVLATYRRALQVVVIAAGALVFLLLDRPGPAGVASVLTVVLILLAALEVLAGPGVATSGPPRTPVDSMPAGGSPSTDT
ncbi:hypothetical protein [Citricoccus sp.]|uniref:hypothetical protein n=1 Tax=Citricoccus sp. TaxID=1978372 RepID=UPI0028BE49FB|nr:hypothetical protein [Citricoccus sp.]